MAQNQGTELDRWIAALGVNSDDSLLDLFMVTPTNQNRYQRVAAGIALRARGHGDIVDQYENEQFRAALAR